MKPEICLVGHERSPYAIASRVRASLERNGQREEAQSFLEAFQGCHGMEETLSLAQQYVEIVE